MRIAIFLLLVGFLQTKATDTYSQNTKLSISFSNTELVKVLDKIENQSEFYFLYNEKLIDATRKVSIEAKDERIEDVLKNLFSGTDVEYSIIDRKIILAPAYLSESQQTSKKISGKVTDSNGGSLPGVSIVVKGTTNGVISDNSGNYSLSNIHENAILQFSFVGMKMQEIKVGTQTSISVVLVDESIGLEEVVAVGYGTQKKTSLTAAVAVVKGAELVSKPVSSISNSLGGQLAGVIVAQSSGEIGNDNSEIHIRGVATFGNNAPLVVVDGVPRDLNKLDPNSIESVTVLKDAAAVAPYGMAGANGVILVTTKKGKTGKPTLSYNAYVGFQNPTTIVKMLNSYDYANMMNASTKNADPNATLPFTTDQIAGFKKTVDGTPGADLDKYPNTDAMDLMRNKSTMMTSHNLSLSGGTDVVKYYMGIGYLKQEGMWSTSNLNRYNLLLNLEAKATKTTTVALSINGSNQITGNPSASAVEVFRTAQAYLPVNAYRFSNGLLANSRNTTVESALRTGQRKYDETRLFTQLSIEQELPFIKGLMAKGIFSYDPTTVFNKNWNEPPLTYYNINTSTSSYTYTPVVSTLKPNLYESEDLVKTYTYQGMLNYNNTFGKHAVSALAVMETRKSDYNGLWTSRQNYDIHIQELNLGSSNSSDWGNGGSSFQSTQVGYVYKLTYGYDKKYLIETAGRYDGNYYFATGKKFGFFPSVSLGWRLSEEKFIKDNLDWVTNLKLKASWGKLGNQNIGNYPWQSSYQLGRDYVFGGVFTQGAALTTLTDPNLRWESTQTSDGGFESSILNGKLNLNISYFYRKTTDILYKPTSSVSTVLGMSLSEMNTGSLKNSGWEIELGHQNKIGAFKYHINGNFTLIRNEVLDLGVGNVTQPNGLIGNGTDLFIGHPMQLYYGLVTDGVFLDQADIDSWYLKNDQTSINPKTSARPGDFRYADLNGDGKVDLSNDRKVLGSQIPKYNFSFNLGFEYRNFDFSAIVQGVAGASGMIDGYAGYAFFNLGTIQEWMWNGRFNPASPVRSPEYPRLQVLGNAPGVNGQLSDFWVLNASYVRIKNLQIGYTFSQGILKTLHVDGLRIYASAENPITWDHYRKGWDPEINSSGDFYPILATYTFGINLKF